MEGGRGRSWARRGEARTRTNMHDNGAAGCRLRMTRSPLWTALGSLAETRLTETARRCHGEKATQRGLRGEEGPHEGQDHIGRLLPETEEHDARSRRPPLVKDQLAEIAVEGQNNPIVFERAPHH